MVSSEIEITGLLYEGLLMELEMWDALSTALSQKWGKTTDAAKGTHGEIVFTGTDDQIRDKMAIHLADTIANYEVSVEDFKNDLAEIMLVNFDLVVEDGSDTQIARSILKLYEELNAGKEEQLNKIRTKYSKYVAKPAKKPVIVEPHPPVTAAAPKPEKKMEEESESEEEEEVDEEGFTIKK